MTIEELIDLQEAGALAREDGVASHDNPHLRVGTMPTGGDACHIADWRARHDAWKFGWEAEDASIEGKLLSQFRSLLPRDMQHRPANKHG